MDIDLSLSGVFLMKTDFDVVHGSPVLHAVLQRSTTAFDLVQIAIHAVNGLTAKTSTTVLETYTEEPIQIEVVEDEESVLVLFEDRIEQVIGNCRELCRS